MTLGPGRVTVYVDENDRITSIRQECEVWLPQGVENGHDLREKLRDVSSTCTTESPTTKGTT